jgi:hypothetical protein
VRRHGRRVVWSGCSSGWPPGTCQGLADAPRRVWRVQGWRRSGRLMGELTAPIREGRIDNQRAVILLSDDRD